MEYCENEWMMPKLLQSSPSGSVTLAKEYNTLKELRSIALIVAILWNNRETDKVVQGLEWNNMVW